MTVYTSKSKEATVRFDTTEWKQAMELYRTFSKKTGAEAVQKQGPKLFFEARKRISGPMGNAIAKKSDIAQVIYSHRFVSWYCNEIFGKGNWGEDEWNSVAPKGMESDNATRGGRDDLSLDRRFSAIKYMYAILSKMGARLADKRIPFETKFPQIKSFKKFQQVSAEKLNTIIIAHARTRTQSKKNNDAATKQKMCLDAIHLSEKAVLADMTVYINRKLKAWAGMHGNA